MTDAVPSSAAEPAGLVFPDLVPPTALALSAMDQLVEAARRSVLERVTGANGKIDAALLDRHQLAAHGFAWLSTYAEGLRQIGAPADRIRTPGNLKYDLPLREVHMPVETPIPRVIRESVGERPLIVAGSTVGGIARSKAEEDLVVRAMSKVWIEYPEAILLLAPRHPDRFKEAHLVAFDGAVYASELKSGLKQLGVEWETIVLDTLGDLASIYGLAKVAFVGGSLVPKGGHNPLEPARSGIPIVMGPSYENFREIVDNMQDASAIRIVDADQLGQTLAELLIDDKGMGARGRAFFEQQSGATARTVAVLLALLHA